MDSVDDPQRADRAVAAQRHRAKATGAELGLDLAPANRSVGMALFRSLRLHQWAKNLLIFVPLVLAGKIHSTEAWAACTLGFVAFGVLASATYILNDLKDIPFDRLHWSKRDRPLANGDMPVIVALVAVPVGVLSSLAIAASVALGAALILVAYGLLTITYSYRLKRVPMLDVLALAALFTLRLVFGAYLAKVAASPWLLVFSMFVFMSLSLAKRHTEVGRSGALGREKVNGRGYVAKDAPLLFGLGLATAVAAVFILILYLINEAFSAAFYKSPLLLWSLPALLFLWLSHFWLLAGRDQLDDDPLRFAVTDKTSLALAAAMVLAFLCAWQL
jgi:4-hydroxybenzoate polyprenyltransferase